MNPSHPESNRKKTPVQIAAIKEAQRATEAAMQAALSYLKSSAAPVSEEARRIVEETLAKRGCESPEGLIVASGAQSAEPHERGSGPIAKGVPIVVDIFPRSKATGYFADMTRTFCIGAPSPELSRMYDAVCTAQDLAFSMIKPKASCAEIQEAVERLFSERGFKTSGTGKEFHFAEGFVHGLGHGVGLAIHESPRIGRGSPDVLEEGDVVTVEPGLYYPGIGGVRLEDLVVVTHNGVRNLTRFPRKLEI